MGPDGPTSTTLVGSISMAADYLRASGAGIEHPLGRIPYAADQAAPVPSLFVCAMDRDGEIDADAPFAGDDDVLGCAATNQTGEYSISISAYGEDAGKELYLVTWFCDGADETLSVLGSSAFKPEATVCVRLNATGDAGERRKSLHSPEQTLAYGETNYLNWNLSCPAASGVHDAVKELACAQNEEEATRVARTNSSVAWNKEFAHLFRAAGQADAYFTSLKPHASGVASKGCGAGGDEACVPCSLDTCLKPIELVVRDAVPAGAMDTLCDPSAKQGEALGYDVACVLHGEDGRAGTLNPFRPLHTMGHLLLRRWLADDSDVPDACGNVSWSGGNDEGRATVEGYANFIPVAAWFSDSASDAEYEGISLVGSPGAAFAGSCGSGTACDCQQGELNGAGRITRFLVDLWDSGADDGVDLKSSDLLRIWSTFDQASERDECGPDGRNMQDFRDHYLQIASTYGWPGQATYDAVAAKNCVDRHTAGNTTCGAAAACGSFP